MYRKAYKLSAPVYVMLTFSLAATVSWENFIEAERSRVASASQRLFRRRKLMVDFPLPHLLPFPCSQRKGESCPTAPQHRPGSAWGCIPFPGGTSRAGAQTGWAVGTQFSPSQAEGTPWAEQCQKKNISVIVLSR